MTTRRRFIRGAVATGAAIAGFPAIVSTARAADPITVSTPQGFTMDFFDLMNAASGGHYARHGLDAKVIGANNGVQMIQFLVAGQAQFGRGSPPDQIRAVAANQPAPLGISAICQGCLFRVISLKDKPILKPEDFKGKTIGLLTLASPSGIYLDVMLMKAGLKPDDVERQATGNTPGAYEILKQGRVDCFFTTLAVEVALKRAKLPILSINPQSYLPLPGQTTMAMPKLTVANPDLVVRFLKASKDSVDEILTQPMAPLLRRAAKDFDIAGAADLDVQVEYLQVATKELWLSRGKENLLRNDPQAWAAGLDALRAAGIADVKDVSRLYTNSFIDKALQG